MKITLEVAVDNAAFAEDWHAEVASILTKEAGKLNAGWHGTLPDFAGTSVFDTNGNRVGGWTLTNDEAPQEEDASGEGALVGELDELLDKLELRRGELDEEGDDG